MHAHKLTLSFKGRILKIFPVATGETRIGRDPACEIAVDNLGIQPLQAIIRLEGDAAYLQDCSENHSTRLNGHKIEERCNLQRGDQVQLGKHTLTYHYETVLTRSQAVENATPVRAASPHNGWLQITRGARLGLTLHLDKPYFLLGKTTQNKAVIATRSDGYYLTRLEDSVSLRVNGQDLGDTSRRLQSGDRIEIDDGGMLFFEKDH